MQNSYRFEVKKDDLKTGALVKRPAIGDIDLGDHQAILAVDKFAVTSNTISYGRAGESFGYWKFFPASEEGMGCLPVWGIGRVVRSHNPDIKVGDRYYGYYSMSDYLVVTVGKSNARGFIEVSPHRQELPILYNQYSLMTPENGFPQDHDDYQIIYKPLFLTSFTLDAFLAENAFFGADMVLLTSASSKTAISLAFMLKRNRDVNVVGLTSDRNAEFVKRLDLYSDVVSYSDIETISAPSVAIVDMAGSAPVVEKLRTCLGERIKYFCGVGSTHWDAKQISGLSKLGGAPFVQYFAPTDIQRFNTEWGADVFQLKLQSAWEEFIGRIGSLVRFSFKSPAQMETFYGELTNGADPGEAVIFLSGAT